MRRYVVCCYVALAHDAGLNGMSEAAGAADNPKIMAMADEIGRNLFQKWSLLRPMPFRFNSVVRS